MNTVFVWVLLLGSRADPNVNNFSGLVFASEASCHAAVSAIAPADRSVIPFCTRAELGK